MQKQEYIEVGNLNKEIFKKIDIPLVTNEVVFTSERINHVESKRSKLFNDVRNLLPDVIYNPDYIYKDWNNRNNTLVLIKSLDKSSKLNVILKIAIFNDDKHPKNSIITMIKIGNKTFNKIRKNKKENLLFKKLDNSA